MGLNEDISEILQEHEMLCKTMAGRIPGNATSGSLKEKLLNMADRAANVDAAFQGYDAAPWAGVMIKDLEHVLQVKERTKDTGN